MRIATVAALVLALSAGAADEKSAVKAIATKDLKVTFADGAKVTAPTEIRSPDELAKSTALKGEAEAIKKSVDFAKEKLVLFMWSGSGGDRLAAALTAGDKTAATFTLSRGLTFDLRQHVHLYVVPKDAEVKVRAK